MVVAKTLFSTEKRQDYCITLLPICAHSPLIEQSTAAGVCAAAHIAPLFQACRLPRKVAQRAKKRIHQIARERSSRRDQIVLLRKQLVNI
jgi:hypothetical protein